MSEFHAEVLQATASEGLAHGPYVVARLGHEPVSLRTQGAEHTTEPPHPHFYLLLLTFITLLGNIIIDYTTIYCIFNDHCSSGLF